MLVGEVPCLSSQARYYLLEEAGNFGVQIELEGEEASVRDLSPSRQKVQDLAEALVQGTVTPVGLRDVVDDWLLEEEGNIYKFFITFAKNPLYKWGRLYYDNHC